MAVRAAKPGEVNYELVDVYTLAHAGWGFILGKKGIGFAEVAMASIGWEIIERPLKNHLPAIFPKSSQDSLQNSIVDATATIAGWWVAQKLK